MALLSQSCFFFFAFWAESLEKAEDEKVGATNSDK